MFAFSWKSFYQLKSTSSTRINASTHISPKMIVNHILRSGRKCLFDNELNADLYANSFESKPDENAVNQSNESSRFNFHSNQNYELLSKRLDANLAEMDIETFSCRLDMNNLLNEINNKFSSTEEVEGADEQLIDHCSVDDSLISEINQRSNALK